MEDLPTFEFEKTSKKLAARLSELHKELAGRRAPLIEKCKTIKGENVEMRFISVRLPDLTYMPMILCSKKGFSECDAYGIDYVGLIPSIDQSGITTQAWAVKVFFIPAKVARIRAIVEFGTGTLTASDYELVPVNPSLKSMENLMFIFPSKR